MAERLQLGLDLDESQTVAALNNVIKKLDGIKKEMSEVGSSSSNFDKLKKDADTLQGSLDQVGGSTNNLTESLGALPGPLGSVSSSVQGLGNQFKALLLNPVVLVLAGIAVVLGTLFKAFSRTEAGSNKLNKAMGVLTAIFNGFLRVLEPVANFIVDVVIYAFEELAKAAEAAMQLVAFGLESLGFDSAAESVREFTGAIGDQIDMAQQLADLEAELIVQRREQSLIEKQALIDAENLRQIRDDESLSIKEKMAANEELAAVLAKQSEQELAIAQKGLQAALLRQKIDGDTPEVLDAIAEAELELLDIQERINGQLSEQKSNINGLRNEWKAAAEERKKQLEEQAQLTRDEAKELRDIRAEIAGDEVDIERNKWNDRIALAKEKYGEESEVITALEFQRQEALLKVEADSKKKKEELKKKEDEAQAERDPGKFDAEVDMKQKRIDAGLEDPNATPEEIMAAFDERQKLEEELYKKEQEILLERRKKENLTDEEFKIYKSQIDQKYSNQAKQIAKDEAEAIKNAENAKKAAKMEFLDAAAGAISSLSSLAEEGTNEAKALALADIAIGTGVGYINALQIAQDSAKSTGPAAASAFPIFYATQIAAVLAAAGKAKNILKSGSKSGGSSGGSGGGGGSAPKIPDPGIPTQLFANQDLQGQEAETIGGAAGLRQQPLKAVVSYTDIKETDQRMNNIIDRSKI